MASERATRDGYSADLRQMLDHLAAHPEAVCYYCGADMSARPYRIHGGLNIACDPCDVLWPDPATIAAPVDVGGLSDAAVSEIVRLSVETVPWR